MYIIILRLFYNLNILVTQFMWFQVLQYIVNYYGLCFYVRRWLKRFILGLNKIILSFSKHSTQPISLVVLCNNLPLGFLQYVDSLCGKGGQHCILPIVQTYVLWDSKWIGSQPKLSSTLYRERATLRKTAVKQLLRYVSESEWVWLPEANTPTPPPSLKDQQRTFDASGVKILKLKYTEAYVLTEESDYNVLKIQSNLKPSIFEFS